MSTDQITTEDKMYRFFDEIKVELKAARKIHGEFSSNHEAIAVIHEEFIELRDEIYKTKSSHVITPEMIKETKQLAAMCFKFIYGRLDAPEFT